MTLSLQAAEGGHRQRTVRLRISGASEDLALYCRSRRSTDLGRQQSLHWGLWWMTGVREVSESLTDVRSRSLDPMPRKEPGRGCLHGGQRLRHPRPSLVRSRWRTFLRRTLTGPAPTGPSQFSAPPVPSGTQSFGGKMPGRKGTKMEFKPFQSCAPS